MSTAYSDIFSGGTVAASTRQREPEAEENPRARRFLLNPGVMGLEVHPTLSGRQQATIPYGFPFRVETFPGMKVRNWSVDPDDKSPPDTERDLTAKEGADNILRAARQGSRDMGSRELKCLTTLPDEDAARLIAAVLPPLPSTGCAYGAENTSEVLIEDHVMVRGELHARVRTVELFRCVTCTLAWLASPECRAEAAKLPHGETLRKQATAAYQTNQRFFATLWSEYDADMKKRARNEPGIGVLDDGHLHVMRQIHQVEPEMRAAEVIRESNAQNAEVQREGMREFAKTLAQELRPAAAEQAPISLDAIKQELLKDPDFRRQLAAEALAEEQQPTPKGVNKGNKEK